MVDKALGAEEFELIEYIVYNKEGQSLNLDSDLLYAIIISIIKEYFLFLQSLHTSASNNRSEGIGWDRHINNGVFLRFGFDYLEVLRKFHLCQEQSNEDARWVCL